mgnify:CR=1 FL=1
MLHFIGFYDYTIILTYLSLISALCGITQATSGHFNAAVICLGICGVCDSFDGRVARSKKIVPKMKKPSVFKLIPYVTL